MTTDQERRRMITVFYYLADGTECSYEVSTREFLTIRQPWIAPVPKVSACNH